jgi:hypothetical protein
VVIGPRRDRTHAVGTALLAGAGLELAAEIQFVGAPRSQMLANDFADRAPKSQACTQLKAPVTRRTFSVHLWNGECPRRRLQNAPKRCYYDSVSTTQRNPMWVVAESCDWGDRAAGR